jgi:Ssp1 endopeptidase immunity protein Rap1a
VSGSIRTTKGARSCGISRLCASHQRYAMAVKEGGLMQKLLLGVVTSLAIMPATAEEDIHSANFMLRYCTTSATDPDSLYLSGRCHGTVETVLSLLGDAAIVCIPSGVTGAQATKVVMRYADLHPELTHRPFVMIVTLAIGETWPCRKP